MALHISSQLNRSDAHLRKKVAKKRGKKKVEKTFRIEKKTVKKLKRDTRGDNEY
jgi:hypothetical protein